MRRRSTSLSYTFRDQLVLASNGKIICIPMKTKLHIANVHSSRLGAYRQQRMETPTYFTVGNWLELVELTIQHGNSCQFKNMTTFALNFPDPIGCCDATKNQPFTIKAVAQWNDLKTAYPVLSW